MNSKIFETSSRKFENFLFAHDIQQVSFYKNELDGLTVWQYAVDDYFVHVLREHKIVLSRKKAEDGEGRGQLKPPPLLRFPRNHPFSFQYPYNMQVFDLFFRLWRKMLHFLKPAL